MNPLDWMRLRRRRDAFQQVLCDQHGRLTRPAQIMMADLAGFCHVAGMMTRPGVPIDPYALALAEGKRQVFLRIIEHISLPPMELQDLRRDDAEDESRWLNSRQQQTA